MKVLYFDCFSGISGDMTLGALLDLGIDKNEFLKELDKLNLDGYRIEISKKSKNGIFGTDVDVILLDENHGHSHHDHNNYNNHHEYNAHHNSHHDHISRNLHDIESLIDKSSLSQKVKDFSKKVFKEIAAAEAKVHNKPIWEVHFHEVGAVDSIVDIVGVAICLELLKIEKVYSSPLHDGKGFIKCQHGMIPVPVPAVMEMLVGSNIPLITTDANTELVTPTGMGIIKCIASEFGAMPPMNVENIGYGMGKRETGRLNALRVVMGVIPEKSNKNLNEDENLNEKILILETNIDDMNPEILGYVMDKLLKNGALDAFYTPIYMKKNRPAVLLTVLGNIADEHKLVDIIFKETTTLGIRISTSRRYYLERSVSSVDTKYGSIKIKKAIYGNVIKTSPEYEDCKKIAENNCLSLREVYNLVNDI